VGEQFCGREGQARSQGGKVLEVFAAAEWILAYED
jgi:hypothetical protein